MSNQIIGRTQLPLVYDAENKVTCDTRGEVIEQPTTATQDAESFALRERAMEDFCYRANVKLHGEEKALRLWKVANQ